MARRVLLEVCVASVDDALAAVAGGADRLEVNSALALGGLTPSAGMFAEIRRAVTVPLIAMVRPRQGGFCYSSTEFDAMLRDAESLLEAGANGLAFGVLTAAGRIDVARTRRLRDLCGSHAAVFHRAFDVTPEPLAALDVLVDLGFQRVMTSGQEETAYYGIPLIADLIQRAAGRIEVLPAGGINRFTVRDVVTRTRCDQVHASLRTATRDNSVDARPQIRFGSSSPGSETRIDQTCSYAVAEIKGLLSQ
jgi:copper homeostasis protein